MQARREKGLCYNCEEKFAPGHRCKTQHIYMLEMVTDDAGDGPKIEEIMEDKEKIQPEISLHALSSISTPQTMRVLGSIHGRKLHILIDSGSTHNFVNSKFVVKLGCCKVPAQVFRVNVANGEFLVCKATYPIVPMEIQGYRFDTSLYSLDLQGFDAVLSVQWLQSLGRVLHDWEKLTMEFTALGRQHLIKGDSPSKCVHGSVHSMQRLLSSGFESFLMQMVDTSMHQVDDHLKLGQSSELDQLLVQY